VLRGVFHRPSPDDARKIAIGVRRLSLLAIVIGLVLVVAALLWWGFFYRSIGLGVALSCLYARGGSCDFIRHVAAEAGRAAYTPALFRLGVVALAGGSLARVAIAVLRRRLRQRQSAQAVRQWSGIGLS